MLYLSSVWSIGFAQVVAALKGYLILTVHVVGTSRVMPDMAFECTFFGTDAVLHDMACSYGSGSFLVPLLPMHHAIDIWSDLGTNHLRFRGAELVAQRVGELSLSHIECYRLTAVLLYYIQPR